MATLDLTQSFKSLVENQAGITPRLKKDLGQVNVVLTGYALSRGLSGDKKSLVVKLSVLDVCTDSEHLHPDLDGYIESLPRRVDYKGQNRTRIKKLVKQLPWESPSITEKEQEELPAQPIPVEAQLPEGLRPLWPLFSRVRTGSSKIPKHLSDISYEQYSQVRSHLALTPLGAALLNVLLNVYLDCGLEDWKSLIEGHNVQIRMTIKKQYPRARWTGIDSEYVKLRHKARNIFGYSVEAPPVLRIPIAEFPEPFRTQVRLFEQRALEGSMPDRDVKQRAKNDYDLDLGEKRSPETIRGYLEALSDIVGLISRDLGIKTLDVKDFLHLEIRDVETEGVLRRKLYNPLVEYVRDCEVKRPNKYKGPDADSVKFEQFLCAIGGVAAYNGFLTSRDALLKEYQANLDLKAREARTQLKKKEFDLEWIDKQIERLSVEFNRIVDERLFISKTDGILTQPARESLNLCLFYIALLTLRFLGVRQQCLRDCLVGVNIVFDALKSIAFEWLKTKNGKGIRHHLTVADDEETHGRLLQDLWTFYKKVYPYISGSPKSPEKSDLKARRPAACGGHFFLQIAKNGLCVPFKNHKAFGTWFTYHAKKFLDFEGRDPEGLLNFNAHFLRGVCSDWLRYVLGFSTKQTSEIVGNTEEVLEGSYLRKIPVYDATDAWTSKNQKLKAKKKGTQQKAIESAQGELVKFLKESLETANREKNEFKEQRDAALEELAAVRSQSARNHSELLAAIKGENAGSGNHSGSIA